MKNGLIKVVNVLGQILSFLTVILWCVWLVNNAMPVFTGGANAGFLPVEYMPMIELIKYWATLLALALSGLELALKNKILLIVYLVAVAACVVLLIVGAEEIMGMISGGIGA